MIDLVESCMESEKALGGRISLVFRKHFWNHIAKLASREAPTFVTRRNVEAQDRGHLGAQQQGGMARVLLLLG